MKNEFDTIIIGAGASGLMLGSMLDKNFIILEKNAKAGAKIAISGGGRCNFTNENISVDNYLGDKEFVADVLSRFGYGDMASLADKWNVPYVTQKNRQLFCKTSANELLYSLIKAAKDKNISLNTEVKGAMFKNGVFEVNTSKGVFAGKTLVIASGGLSYTTLGASGIGYEIASGFGHTLIPTSPALVGFTVQPGEAWFKGLSGVSVPSRAQVGDKVFNENVLFAHKGISGPAILNASLYWKKGSVTIDFLPGLDIDKALQGGLKQVTSVLGLPKRVTKAYLDFVGISDKSIDKLSDSEKESIKRLKNYEFAPAGTFGYTKAEITKGGINTSEIDPKTMQSKIQEGLCFMGEVLDVSGELGGYNFHFAFACAKVCADAIRRT